MKAAALPPWPPVAGSDEEENEPLLKPFNGNTFFGSPVKITEAGWKRPGHSARHV